MLKEFVLSRWVLGAAAIDRLRWRDSVTGKCKHDDDQSVREYRDESLIRNMTDLRGLEYYRENSARKTE